MQVNLVERETLRNVRKVHGLGVAVACLIAASFYYFLFVPLAQEAEGHQGRAAELDQAMRAAPKTRADNERMQSEIAQARARLNELMALVPETTREAEFLQQLAESAHAAGIELRDFRPGSVRALDRYHELEVHVSAAGDFQSLSRWLYQIGKLPRLTRTRSLTVASAPSESGRRCVLTMTLAVLFGAKTEAKGRG